MAITVGALATQTRTPPYIDTKAEQLPQNWSSFGVTASAMISFTVSRGGS